MTGTIVTMWLYTMPVAVLLVETKGTEWTIRGTWVSEWCRGRGVGEKLLTDFLKDFDKENPQGELWVNITPGAEGFYAKYGFRIPGYRTDTPESMAVGLYGKCKPDIRWWQKFGNNFVFEEIFSQ